MKTSVFIAGTSAILAAASPIKRAYETEWVTDYVTVYVTGGQEAPQATQVYNVPAEPKKEDTNVYTTVFVQSQPETTSQPVVEYTTIWYGAESPQSTSTSTSAKAKETTTTDYGSGTSSGNTGSSGSGSADNGKPSDKKVDWSLSGDYSVVLTNYHNNHRRNHSASDLAWHEGLASAAKKIAATCKFEHDMSKNIPGEGPKGDGENVVYGQNIASWGSTDAPMNAENKYGAISVTNQWYNSEAMNWEPYYDQANPPSEEVLALDAYGHFTQLVWKDTTHVGCATQYCPGLYSFPSYYTVCNYLGAGNYGGKYAENVDKPVGANHYEYHSV